MEELTRLTGLRSRAAVVLAVLGLALGAAVAGRADEAELSRALKALGAPGTLWGRLAVEEESPDGPWTPLVGVTVTAYPYTAALAADLERIRDGARASGRDYDVAIGRLQERLTAHATQVGALTGTPVPTAAPPGAALPPGAPPPSGTAVPPGTALPPGGPLPPGAPPPSPASKTSTPGILSELAGRFGLAEKGSTAPATPAGEGAAPAPATEGLIRQATTDATGLFLFKFLPAGDWLVVAVQTSAYSAPRRAPSSSTRAAPGKNRDGFLERERPQAREAEVWVIRARVLSDEPARLLLTDRSRFMVGPVR